MKYLTVALCVMLFTSSIALGQQAGGMFKGVVYDKSTNEPIAFASVIVESKKQIFASVTTDFDGTFVIAEVPPRKFKVIACKEDYKLVEIEALVFKPDGVTIHDFYLKLQQTDTLREIRGLVLDEETEEPIDLATITIVGTDGSSTEVLTDSTGNFKSTLNKKHSYIISADKRTKRDKNEDTYLMRTCKVSPGNSDTVLTFKLHVSDFSDYFQEFTFAKNSTETNNPDDFMAWYINEYQDTIHQIKVVGYSAPDETEDIAIKRANKIIDGFVAAGANRRSFIAADGNPGYPGIHYRWEINDIGKTIKLNTKTVLTDDFVNPLSAEGKAAIFNFMRRVQLQWYRKEN